MKRYRQDPFKMRTLDFVRRFTNCRLNKQGKYKTPSPTKRQAHLLGLTYPLPRGWIKLIQQTTLTHEQRIEFMQLFQPPIIPAPYTGQMRLDKIAQKKKIDLANLKQRVRLQKKQANTLIETSK